MLLTTVILILQETLEAALLVSILAAITVQSGRRLVWLPWGLGAGCVLAWIYASNIRRISEWFDYVGQELTNAALQTSIALVVVWLAWLIGKSNDGASPHKSQEGTLFVPLCALTVALAITREGSEILVFLFGFLGQHEQVRAVLTGSGVGFGIGVSVGILVFYALCALRGRRGRWIPLVLLALFGGNMLAQASLQLTQADWLGAGPALWNSAAWLPEHSLAGRLLYALVGYESSPSAAQVVSYLMGLAAVVLATLLGRRLQ